MRVLVAEDNLTNQMVVRAMLSRLGQTVEIVGDGAPAVEAVRRSAGLSERVLGKKKL
jgi:CheY-like chemotaxis protein